MSALSTVIWVLPVKDSSLVQTERQQKPPDKPSAPIAPGGMLLAPRPRPGFLIVLLRALSAWHT
jgi:hypothetical protein